MLEIMALWQLLFTRTTSAAPEAELKLKDGCNVLPTPLEKSAWRSLVYDFLLFLNFQSNYHYHGKLKISKLLSLPFQEFRQTITQI